MVIRTGNRALTLRFFLCGVAVSLLLFHAWTWLLAGDTGMLDLEEVSGVSVRDIDALHKLSPEYALNPDGGEVPGSSDTWLPDMSLAHSPNPLRAGSSATETASISPQYGYDSQTSVPTTNPPKQLSFDSTPALQSADSSDLIRSPAELAKTARERDARSSALANPNDISSPLEEAESPEGKVISDIRCSEGIEMPINRFNKLVKTKIGGIFKQQQLEDDKRALLQTKQYVDVIVSTSPDPEHPDQVIVNFDFTPRRLMRYVKVIGNKKLSKSEILEELGMKRGETRMDPYDVENGRLRIIELYKSKDYNEPYVEILRGNRPEDIGVIYLIDEGIKQRVIKTKFTGNTVVSSARLRTLISLKPGILYFIGGTFSRERLDEDVLKLLEYYRALGYFDARIDREYEEGEWYGGLGNDNAWITVHYIIDEGPRYRIRQFLFEGNHVMTSDQLRDLLNIQPGDYFNQNEVEGDRITLTNAYQDIGYVRAEVNPTQIFTENEAEVDIRYTINEDYRYRIKDIVIQYDGEESRTKASVVMNLLDFAPSQIAVGPKIRSSENNLQRSGYFNTSPTEGPLPTISIVPEEENLYYSEVTAADGSREKNISVSEELRRREKKKGNGVAFLGMLSRSKEDSSKAKEDQDQKQNEDRGREESPALLDSTSTEPILPSYGGDIVRGQDRENFVPCSADGTSAVVGGVVSFAAPATPSSSASLSAGAPLTSKSAWKGNDYVRFPSTPMPATSSVDSTIIRGQTQAIQTGLPSTTTYGTAPASPASSWNGSNYISYPSSSGTNSYADTSNYNNGAVANASSVQPPLETVNAGSQNGYYSGTIANGVNYSAPGFSTGRDAVFPGSQEQQFLDSELGGGTGPNDPIRNATVIARIMEGRTATLQASIGVNSNSGLVGNVSYTERNFDLFRWPSSLCRMDGWSDAFRGGGQIFRAEAAPGTTLSRYLISWDVPYVFNTRYNFGVTGLYADHYFEDWYEAHAGGDVRFGRSWTNRFSTTLDVGLYDVRIYRPSTDLVPDLNDVLGHNSKYSFGLTATYDTRNHPYQPSEGYYITGSAEYVTGKYKYPRLSYDAQTFFKLHQRADASGKVTLGLRSMAGWTGGSTPIYDRFYGGGYQNLRGFEYRGVTPRYLDSDFGIGGYFEIYNSAELLVPISGGDELQLAFFVDTGTVAESIDKWGTYRVAPGCGFRVAIPMFGPAPLAFDFAFPVSKSNSDDTEVFSFSMSGSR